MSETSLGRTALVLGGARSGKSRVALEMGRATSGRRAFVATCRVDLGDAEMAERVSAHRERRAASWETIEEPLDLGECVDALSRTHDVIVADCLTLWLSNLIEREEGDAGIARRLDCLTASIAASRARVIVVSNEVGMGIVPAAHLGRRFRDWQGLVNQAVAEAVNDVYIVTAGLARRLKPIGVS
ncbi:MAG: bifunctional adenosylcobinamide kinase/adenosylcobinamide-phosphate guanylyltransferase [Nitrospirota bacterium]